MLGLLMFVEEGEPTLYQCVELARRTTCAGEEAQVSTATMSCRLGLHQACALAASSARSSSADI